MLGSELEWSETFVLFCVCVCGGEGGLHQAGRGTMIIAGFSPGIMPSVLPPMPYCAFSSSPNALLMESV